MNERNKLQINGIDSLHSSHEPIRAVNGAFFKPRMARIYTTKRRGRCADLGGWAAARETAKAARRVRRLREARINSNRRLARRANRDLGTSRERLPQGSSEGVAGWENLRIK